MGKGLGPDMTAADIAAAKTAATGRGEIAGLNRSAAEGEAGASAAQMKADQAAHDVSELRRDVSELRRANQALAEKSGAATGRPGSWGSFQADQAPRTSAGPQTSTSSNPVSPASNNSPTPQGDLTTPGSANQVVHSVEPNQFSQILDALIGDSPMRSGVGPVKGRRGQLDPYNSPIGQSGVSPADAARSVYLDAAQGGNPVTGRRGSPITKDRFPDAINAKLADMTGDANATGIAKKQMWKRLKGAEPEIADLAKREGLSWQEAAQKYIDANPTTGTNGLRRNLPELMLPGAIAGGALVGGSNDADAAQSDPHAAIVAALMAKQNGVGRSQTVDPRVARIVQSLSRGN